jgi:hypothetical protein
VLWLITGTRRSTFEYFGHSENQNKTNQQTNKQTNKQTAKKTNKCCNGFTLNTVSNVVLSPLLCSFVARPEWVSTRNQGSTITFQPAPAMSRAAPTMSHAAHFADNSPKPWRLKRLLPPPSQADPKSRWSRPVESPGNAERLLVAAE